MTDASSPPPVSSGSTPRRGFLAKAASIVIGGFVALTPVVAGLLFILDPLRLGLDRLRIRKKPGGTGPGVGKEGFIKIGRIDSVPADGKPVKFTVIADRVDAWNTFPQEPIGAVYVRRADAGKFLCFSVICPHLGCSVDCVAGATKFHCPCHDSGFDLNGIRTNQTPPRDLDTLELDEEKFAVGELWVKYQTFRTGEAHKVVKS